MELELSRAPVSSSSPRLSTVLGGSLFVAPLIPPRYTEDSIATPKPTSSRSIPCNDLDSSLYHVKPYPPRKSGDPVVPESPDKRHLEGVYDQFLMVTSGVKRVGKGCQSENLRPLHNIINTTEHAKASHARGFGIFGTNKRPLPPPISSEDAWGRPTDTDELGFLTTTSTPPSHACRDENKATFVRRAIKAMVPGRTTSRRLSRTIVV